MTQPKTHSFLEVCANTATGFIISFAATFAVMPLLNIHTNASQNFWMTFIYTFISIARSYFWRRTFNYFQWRQF